MVADARNKGEKPATLSFEDRLLLIQRLQEIIDLMHDVKRSSPEWEKLYHERLAIVRRLSDGQPPGWPTYA